MNRLQELAQQYPALNDALHALVQASSTDKLTKHAYACGIIQGLVLADALTLSESTALNVSICNMMIASTAGFDA